MARPAARVTAQDKELKDIAAEVHAGLYSLAKVYKPSAEFDKHFEKGMFIKSNPNALPHVLHFLLYHLDPAEFSSRFLWPLHSDKAQEKDFRQRCIKYINEVVIKKYPTDLEEVGHYFVVMPGGLKFMKVLLGLIRILQAETLRSHGRQDYVQLEGGQIFNPEFRADAHNQFRASQRAHADFTLAVRRETKTFQKRIDLANYLAGNTKTANRDVAVDSENLRREVASLCGRMQQVVRIVKDMETRSGAEVAEDQIDAFQRIELDGAIARILEHHEWAFPSNGEATQKVNRAVIHEVTQKILHEISAVPIDASAVNPLELVNRIDDISQISRQLSLLGADLRTLECKNEMDRKRHEDIERFRPGIKIVFPERDYKLHEDEEINLGAYYLDLQKDRSELPPSHLRLPLQDVIPEIKQQQSPTAVLEASSSKLFTAHKTTSKNYSTTSRKRTAAMSVLKTISRSNKRTQKSKFNMDALRELAKNGFNDSMMDSSQMTWKKKSFNTSLAETSVVEPCSRQPMGGASNRLSALFSDSMARFHSTAIFNSTELALHDVTNKEPKEPKKSVPDANTSGVAKPLFTAISTLEDQENILDCSDSILIN